MKEGKWSRERYRAACDAGKSVIDAHWAYALSKGHTRDAICDASAIMQAKDIDTGFCVENNLEWARIIELQVALAEACDPSTTAEERAELRKLVDAVSKPVVEPKPVIKHPFGCDCNACEWFRAENGS